MRNRTSDIPQLVLSQAAAVCTRLGLPSKEVSDEFFETLATYHWPGNVRELLNAVDHAIAMEPHCPTLYPKHLPEYIRMHAIGRHPGGLAQGVMQVPPPTADPQGDFPTLKHYRQSAIERVEKRYLATLMSHCGGDVDTACAVSGIKRARMYQLLKKYEHDI